MFQGNFPFVLVWWLIFIALLIQGIREKNKVKIVISSILVTLPLIFLVWLVYLIAYT